MELKIKQISWWDSHFYLITYKDGKEEISDYFPSVTTKLQAEAKPFLAQWRGDIGNREADMIMNDAAHRGSRIHLAWDIMTTKGAVLFNPIERPNYSPVEIDKIRNKFDGNIIVLNSQSEMYDVYKLQQWHEILQPEIIHSETNVYSLKFKEAGQVDKIVRIKEGEYLINGKTPLKLPAGIYIVDLKTGKQVDKSAYMQVAAYAGCYTEMGEDKPIGTLIVHTGAKTKSGLSTHYRDIEQMREDYQNYRAVATVWDRLFSGQKPKVFSFPSLIKLDN